MRIRPGSIDHRANPELRNVRLYTGEPDPLGEDLPTVEVFAKGKEDCSAVAARALSNLLAQAEAVAIYFPFVFSSPSWSAMNARISSAMSRTRVHCSL